MSSDSSIVNSGAGSHASRQGATVSVAGTPGSSLGDSLESQANFQPTLQAGDRIGGCKISRFVARGGMGEVYEGIHETLDRRVAIKLICGTRSKDHDYRTRFLREAKAAARLTEPHVVLVFDAGEDKKHLYVVMEYIEGEDAARRLARQGPLPPADALRIIRDAALGLAAAHSVGLIHRDIKPGNIMVTAQGTAKLTDFGLVQLMHLEPTPAEAAMITGTPPYISPELWRGESVDGSADLYALGVTLYELLAGKLPINGETYAEISRKARAHERPTLQSQRPDLPTEVCDLVESLLAPAPERLKSAHTLVKAIDQILLHLGQATTVGAPMSGVFAPRRAGWKIIAACLALVATIVCASYLMSGPWPKTAQELSPPDLKDAAVPAVGAKLAPIQLDVALLGQRRIGREEWEDVDLLKEMWLRSGDQFQLWITPHAPCYLYVILRTSQGESMLLFPPTGTARDARVEGGKAICLPEKKSQIDLWYSVDYSPGDEILYVAACYEPAPSLTNLFVEITDGKVPVEQCQAALEGVRQAAPPRGMTIDETRGLTGVVMGNRVKIKLPTQEERELSSEIITGRAGLVRQFVLTHK